MGTSLYRVKINKIERDTASCRIYIINPDAGDIHITKTFALSLIIECWDKLLNGYFFPGESILPISEEEAKNLATNTPIFQIFKELRKSAYGYEKEITKEEYDESLANHEYGRPYKYKGISVVGFDTKMDGEIERYYALMLEDDGKHKIEAERYIEYVKLENKENYEWLITNYNESEEKIKHYESLDTTPQGDLVFKVTNLELLSILVPNAEWETYNYW
ncbi:MAG: hypothetical protein KGD63_01665 [Candidatus Lokiarchaeota archaeon]|nr:hypothetical protein [Candidatus Lokiarchaeota archaeon]